MKFRTLLSFLICSIFIFETNAQTYTILPWLSGNLYGLANADGKMLVSPRYEGVVGTGYNELIAVKQEGLWGLCNNKGEIVFPISLNLTKTYRRDYGPIVQSILPKGWIMNYKEPNIKPDLFEIEDPSTGNIYYINPSLSKPSYTPYQKTSDLAPFLDREGDCIRTGLIKVTMKGGGINFLDSSGMEVLSSPILNGMALGGNAFIISDSGGKIKIIDRQANELTNGAYDRVNKTNNPNVYMLYRNETGVFHCFNSHGKLIAEQYYDDIKVFGNRVLINEHKTGKILDEQGRLVEEFPGYNLQLFTSYYTYVPQERFLISSNNSIAYGLLSLEGEFVLEPSYTTLYPLRNGEVGFHTGNYGGLMDTLLQERWRKDSIKVVDFFTESGGYYMFHKIGRGGYCKGIIDSLGNILVDGRYSDIIYRHEVDLFELNTQDSTAFVNKQGKLVVPFCEGKGEVSHDDKIIIHGKGKDHIYSSLGVHQGDKDAWKPELVIRYKGANYFLEDHSGAALTEAIYSHIQIKEDYHSNSRIYLAVRSDFKADAFDDSGLNICPTGYVVEIRNDVVYTPVDQGLIQVIYEDDMKRNLVLPRRGVINFKGEWTVPPDHQNLQRIKVEYFTTSDSTYRHTALYNRHGEIITNKPYAFPTKGNGVEVSHDRILVIYMQDSLAYERYVDSIELWRKGRIAKQPDATNLYFTQGFINLRGEEVIKPVYDRVEDFIQGRGMVFGQDADSKSYAWVIDTNGQPVFKTNYDDFIRIFGWRTELMYVVHHQGKYGVLDSMGKVIVPIVYNYIEKLESVPNSFYATDYTNTYFIQPGFSPVRIGPIGEVKAGIVNGMIRTTVEAVNINESEINFYDIKMNHLLELKGVRRANGAFAEFLPEGFMAVEDDGTSLPYVIHIKTGRKFKE